MRTLPHTLFALLTLSLAFLFLPSTPLRADEPAVKPAAVAQVGFVAGKSLDAISAFAKLAGFELPPPLTADGIEQQFAFIGKGGVATDQPIGIALVGGPDTKPEQMIVFVIPVKPTAATLDSLKAQGGTPMPDHPDTMMLGGAAVRRTADYAIFSPNPPAVAAVNIGALADAVKAGDALVKVSIDLKGVRENMPEQYKQMLGMLSSGGGDKNAAVVAAPVAKQFETLNRLEASLDNGDNGVRLAFTAAPMKVPAVTAANRPGMPPGVLARMDTGVAAGDAVPSARDMFTSLSNAAKENGPGGKPLTDDQKKQVDALMAQVSKFELEPAAISVGVEIIAGEPVVYIVQHWSKPIDISKEIPQTVGMLNSLMKTTEPASQADLQTYQSDGVRVLRVVAMDHDKPQGYLDVAQKDNDVYMTICPNQYRYIHKLMAAKDEGPIQSTFSASLDLQKLVTALVQPTAPLAGMPADTRKQLVELVQGQKLTVASKSDGDAATVELTVTKGLLQNAPKLMALFGLGGGGASPATSETAMSNARQILLGCVMYSDKNKAWPDTLDQIADNVGGKDQLAKLQSSGRGGTFTYVKPADLTKDLDKTIVLYETFPAGTATPDKIVAGYADGHIVMVDPAEVKK